MGATLHWHSNALFNIEYAQQTGQLFSAGMEGVMVMWAQSTFTPAFIPRVATRICSFTVSADGTRLFVACSDNVIRFISATEKQVIGAIVGFSIGSVWLKEGSFIHSYNIFIRIFCFKV